MNEKAGKSLQISYLRKLETVAMYFPVPKLTASRVTFLIHLNESGRRFAMETSVISPCGHCTIPPYFVPARDAASTFFIRKGAPTFTLKKMPSRQEVHLDLRLHQ